MSIQCPHCSSEHVQSIKAIRQSGTSYSSGSMSGVGLSADGGGVFTGSGSSINQTALAARFAPPAKPKKLEIIAGGVLSAACSPFLLSKSPLMILSLGMLAWWAWEIRAYRQRDQKYKEQYPHWKELHDHGFYCHRCAHSFLVKA